MLRLEKDNNKKSIVTGKLENIDGERVWQFIPTGIQQQNQINKINFFLKYCTKISIFFKY